MYVNAHTLNCRQTLQYLVVGVQTGVLAATIIYNNPRAELAVCVHTQCMILRSI